MQHCFNLFASFQRAERLAAPIGAVWRCLHAGSVNPLAPARSLGLLERICTPKTHELPSPSQLHGARAHSERVLLAQPGTHQMGGSISPSSYPQRFLNEMSFVVTTTSVRGNKRERDLNGLYGRDKDTGTSSHKQSQGSTGRETVSDEQGSREGRAGSAPREELGDPVALRHTLHIPASHFCVHTPNAGTYSRSGTAARCLPLLDTSAGTLAWPPDSTGRSGQSLSSSQWFCIASC